MNWDILEDEKIDMIYGSDLETELKVSGYNIENILTEEQIKQIENTPTAEYKKACWNEFIDSIKNKLPVFDNKLKYALEAAFLLLNQNGTPELTKKALNEYMNEIGCDSKEKTISILNKTLNIEKTQGQEQENLKEFDPFFYNNDGGKQYEIYFSTNHNPNSSNYHSKLSAEHALVVDTENKRYGLLSGAYSFNGTKFYDYEKAPDLSVKKLREKIEQLESYGFKFQKFTTKAGEYSQGNPRSLYPKNRQKDLNIGYER